MTLLYSISNSSNKALKFYLLRQARSKKFSLVELRQITTSSSSNPSQSSSSSGGAAANNDGPKKAKSGGGKFKTFAFVLTGFSIGLGYAAFNPDFRRQVGSTIPQSNALFNYLDEFLIEIKKSLPGFSSNQVVVEPPSKLPTPAPKQQQQQPPQQQKSENSNQKALNQQTEQLRESTTSAISSSGTSSNKVQATETEKDLDWKSALNKLDIQEEAVINSIENKLRTLSSSIKLRVSEALNSSYVAIESLNKYRQALRHALDDETKSDNEKDLQWRLVTDLFDLQSRDVNEANQRFSLARKLMEDLDKLVKEIKSSDLSRQVKLVQDAQLDLINQYRQLESENSKLSEAIIHANVLKSYTVEQKLARNQFLKEIQSLQPEGIHIAKRSEDQMTNEEINSLLIHAHKRVLQLQKQLEKVQLAQNQQVQAALEDQRKQNAELFKKIEQTQREILSKEFELEKEKLSEAERAKAQEELRRELARQAAAHNNHLAQMLRIQLEELTSLFDKKLIDEREKIRLEFNSKVADSMGRIKGIENALNARFDLELQATNARKLWLAVQNLNELLSSKDGAADSSLSSLDLVDIKANIDTIKKLASENQFIQNILNSIRPNVLDGGVMVETDLKTRFHNLKTTCSRVALIDDRGGSLFKYFISYLQSLFIMRTRLDKSELLSSGGDSNEHLILVDDANLNTFNILDYAEHYLENGNIELAIKLMQQLSGEPYRLAKDWITDATSLLEIKQACDLLVAYISSVYIGTNLK